MAAKKNQGYVLPLVLMVTGLIAAVAFSIAYLNYYETQRLVDVQNRLVARYSTDTVIAVTNLINVTGDVKYIGTFPRDSFDFPVKYEVLPGKIVKISIADQHYISQVDEVGNIILQD